MEGDLVGPSWFDTPIWPASQLTDALSRLASPQRLSDADYEQRVRASRGVTTIFVDVELTAQMRSLLAGPVENVAPLAPGAEPYKARSAADYWLGSHLQAAALDQIDALPMVTDRKGRIWRLYDSPKAYQQIVAAAVSAVLQQSFFSFSEFRNPPATTKGPGDNRSIQISYRARVAGYSTDKSLRNVASYLAF